MATDPRARAILNYNTTQTFAVKQCYGSGITEGRRDFFDAVDKIGNLEILNDIGFGRVGEGMRVLSSISNSARKGTVLGSVWGSVETGVNEILTAVGINPAAVAIAESLHPEVANRAYGQAKQIYEKIKRGEFSIKDIPYYFQDFQNLEQLINGVWYDGRQRDTAAAARQQCEASPWAMDLISFYPKYKFLFVIEILMNANYTEQYKPFIDYFAFVVKSSSRPGVQFEYEDVNFYNFRTRVARRAMLQPITMTFYDDNQNSAITFYNKYLMAMSPNTRNRYDNLQTDVSGNLEELGMNFLTSSSQTDLNSASLGSPIGVNTTSLIREIKLYHVFREGRKTDIYHLYNPRITNMKLDDVDYADGEGSMVTFDFIPDAIHIETGVNLNDIQSIDHLSGYRAGAKFAWQPDTTRTASLPSDGDSGTYAQRLKSPAHLEVKGPAKNIVSGFQEILGGFIKGVKDFVGDIFSSDAFTRARDFIGSAFSTTGTPPLSSWTNEDLYGQDLGAQLSQYSQGSGGGPVGEYISNATSNIRTVVGGFISGGPTTTTSSTTTSSPSPARTFPLPDFGVKKIRELDIFKPAKPFLDL